MPLHLHHALAAVLAGEQPDQRLRRVLDAVDDVLLHFQFAGGDPGLQVGERGVALVPAEAYRNSTVANTIKDILDYVPGVFAQPKWGDDTRLSIRGSGLSRNFHLRGIQLYMDGIPINTSDGYGDFQEVDPTAYKYVEVYKGGNALQFGANSLGGAINFVTPDRKSVV